MVKAERKKMQSDLMADRCQNDTCAGVNPVYPDAVRQEGSTIRAFYHCPRCGQAWTCGWNPEVLAPSDDDIPEIDPEDFPVKRRW